MSVFVTVGSTGFDALVQATTCTSFLSHLLSQGYTQLVVQYGASASIYAQAINTPVHGINVRGYTYASCIEKDMREADLIICHAGNGSGTLLQALRLNKQVVSVVNPHLMDNHQYELANALEEKGYSGGGNDSHLISALQGLGKKSQVSFPSQDTHLFSTLLDEHMGFIG
ncbi:glycosyltransferase family 1 protein [Spinellus fusiger]|nr:glycosyltransferase family 1 protein [Spinellus fusiger]